jgi:hypothetical protein
MAAATVTVAEIVGTVEIIVAAVRCATADTVDDPIISGTALTVVTAFDAFVRIPRRHQQRRR